MSQVVVSMPKLTLCRMNFSQSFISHAYLELHMPPDPTKPGAYAMDRNHLHIWPRHSFMLIGLPNIVGEADNGASQR